MAFNVTIEIKDWILFPQCLVDYEGDSDDDEEEEDGINFDGENGKEIREERKYKKKLKL